MILSPVEHASSLRIGWVEFVAPDKIEVILDANAPEGMAGNAGPPRPFPRVHSYVLVGTEEGHVVAQVEWITLQRAPPPRRKDSKDHGLIDLPFPIRRMRANPLGVLRAEGDGAAPRFRRGVHSFPSVGASVLIPTDAQVRAVVESGKNRRVEIGTCPLAYNASVRVDPDRLFGRHLAVLGNTGSGKSCSIAGLVQWSLDAARGELKQSDGKPNARFIVLDPNGEYSKVFGGKARVFQVEGESPLKVPLWLWNTSEWVAFTRASDRAQIPLLRQALRAVRNEQGNERIPVETKIRKLLVDLLQRLQWGVQANPSEFEDLPRKKGFHSTVLTVYKNLMWYQKQDGDYAKLQGCLDLLEAYKSKYDKQYPDAPSRECLEPLLEKVKEEHDSFGENGDSNPLKGEDDPYPFSGQAFMDALEQAVQGGGNGRYNAFWLERVRTLLSDRRMRAITDHPTDSLSEWLEGCVGETGEDDKVATVIDLSLVPVEVVHIVTAVIARMIFEALQRYKKIEDGSLPTTLIVEEAHTFVGRYREDNENQTVAATCCRVFEKIAREGRKFGLGLVLSSQRPSELSPTVLSQCNSFLLHRISNSQDQELVNRLVPDNLRGLLRELPSLPTQQAILLGWAAELPVLVQMNDLPDEMRPSSDDPEFWKVWTGESSREVDWKKVAEDWQGVKQDDTADAPVKEASDGTADTPGEEVSDDSSSMPDDDIPF